MRNHPGIVREILVLVLCSLPAWSAWGQDSESESESTPPNPLRGIAIVGHPDQVRAGPRPDVDRVVVEGPEFLRPHVGMLNERLQPYFGRDLNEDRARWLTNVLREIIAVCASPQVDRRVVDVFFPRPINDFSKGRVQVVVFEGKLGDLKLDWRRKPVFGGEPVPVDPAERRKSWQRIEDRVRAGLPIKRGDSIDDAQLREFSRFVDRRLNSDLDFRRASVALNQGEYIGEADVLVSIEDRFPLEAFVGYDDTGNTLTKIDRFSAGAVYHDLWNEGHRVAYQFTSDYGFKRFLAHAASYHAPLPWGGHSVTAFGGYSDVELDLSRLGIAPSGTDEITQGGQNVISGFRYNVPLKDVLRADGRSIRLRHELFAGFDYKDVDTTLEFSASDDQIPTSTFTVNEFVLGYRAIAPDKWGSSQISLQSFLSPGGLMGENSDEAFNQARPGAKAAYAYGRLSAGRETRLVPDWLWWDVSGIVQLASGALVASEQLALGGADTVRGFEQGVALGDHGVVVRNEVGLEVPQLNNWIRRWSTSESQARFRVFFDYGVPFDDGDSSGGGDGLSLGSVGGGVVVKVGRLIDAVVDYGIQVIGEDAETRSSSAAEDISGRFHVALRVRF